MRVTKGDFQNIHLDPSLDRPVAHQELCDLLCGLWTQILLAKGRYQADTFENALLTDLESRLVAMALVLRIKGESTT
jgi:hypothetical protein